MELYELFSECLSADYLHSNGSADYAVRRDGDTLYIFFEDSSGSTDWKSNLNFPARAYKRMKKTVWYAHRGFLRVWKQTEPLISDAVMDSTVKKIVTVGYSHGAAIAVLCHEYAWYHRADIRRSVYGYGFGCPRVFYGKKTPSLMRRWENFLVIRNIDDIVTHLPPRFLGFHHVGKMLHIGKAGKYSSVTAHFPRNILKELKIYSRKKKNAESNQGVNQSTV